MPHVLLTYSLTRSSILALYRDSIPSLLPLIDEAEAEAEAEAGDQNRLEIDAESKSSEADCKLVVWKFQSL